MRQIYSCVRIFSDYLGIVFSILSNKFKAIDYFFSLTKSDFEFNDDLIYYGLENSSI